MTAQKKFHSTEFYYAESTTIAGSQIRLSKDESNHAINVMRHVVDDILNVTDGQGSVYECKIISATQKETLLSIESKTLTVNKYVNFKFFLPILKSADRLEYAIEKAVELGITNLVIYSSENSYKRSIKLERCEKIAISAMKQSLRTFKPEIKFYKSLNQIALSQDLFIIFDQLAEEKLICSKHLKDRKINLVFGPEAGLSENEIELCPNKRFLNLSDSRLRTETAVIAAATILTGC